MNLWSDFLTNDGRLIHEWKHYFPIYERHFGEFVYKPVTVLEIGCGSGGSLQMWKRYFGPHATIVGIEGGFRRLGTFIELCKTLLDELNADHTRGAFPPTEFTRTTLAMHFYDSVAVFERGTHTRKWAPRIGQEP
jgi:hypothetical protein